MKQHPDLLIAHTDHCPSCGAKRELRIVQWITDGIQILFAVIAIVVLAYALYAWIFEGVA